jgi:transposase
VATGDEIRGRTNTEARTSFAVSSGSQQSQSAVPHVPRLPQAPRRETELNLTRPERAARRLRALEMFRAGSTRADVARALRVSHSTACDWAATAQSTDGVLVRKAPERGPLVPMATIEEVFRQRAKWRPRALAAAVFEATGVRYHPSTIWEKLANARKPERGPLVPMATIEEVFSQRPKAGRRALAAAVFEATGVRYHPSTIWRKLANARKAAGA